MAKNVQIDDSDPKLLRFQHWQVQMLTPELESIIKCQDFERQNCQNSVNFCQEKIPKILEFSAKKMSLKVKAELGSTYPHHVRIHVWLLLHFPEIFQRFSNFGKFSFCYFLTFNRSRNEPHVLSKIVKNWSKAPKIQFFHGKICLPWTNDYFPNLTFSHQKLPKNAKNYKIDYYWQASNAVSIITKK